MEVQQKVQVFEVLEVQVLEVWAKALPRLHFAKLSPAPRRNRARRYRLYEARPGKQDTSWSVLATTLNARCEP